MCVVLFYSRKPPDYPSYVPLSFSMLPLKLATEVSKCHLLLVKSVVPGRKSRNIHGFPLQCGAALSPPGEVLKVQGSKAAFKLNEMRDLVAEIGHAST